VAAAATWRRSTNVNEKKSQTTDFPRGSTAKHYDLTMRADFRLPRLRDGFQRRQRRRNNGRPLCNIIPAYRTVGMAIAVIWSVIARLRRRPTGPSVAESGVSRAVLWLLLLLLPTPTPTPPFLGDTRRRLTSMLYHHSLLFLMWMRGIVDWA
jgi:hypothetical protein